MLDSTGTQHSKHSFHLDGGGMAGDLFRSIDWSTHAVGPSQDWPAALKISLNLIFHSEHPMIIFWGGDALQFFNDAYRSCVSNSGSLMAAMGVSAVETWGEHWPLIKPQIDRVLGGQGAIRIENQPITIIRNGKKEATYWTYGYSPIYSEKGSIDGVLLVCEETTNKIAALKIEKENQEKLKAIFYGVDAPLALFRGPNLIIEMANTKYIEAVQGRDVIGKPLLTAVPEIASSNFPSILRHVYETGESRWTIEGKTPLFNKTTGQYEIRYFDTRIHRITDSPKDEMLIVAHAMDVTERVYARLAQDNLEKEIQRSHREVEAARDELHSFFMQVPMPMMLLMGSDFYFSMANPFFEKFVGRKVIGKTLRDVLTDAEYRHYKPILTRVFETGETFVGKGLNWKMIDNEDQTKQATINVVYTPFRDKNNIIRGILVFAQDVTEEYAASADIEQYNRELEIARNEAEKANILKTAFLTNMSHELRTPLGTILGFSDVLKSSSLSGEQNRYLEIITRSGQSLVKIIDDILDLSKLEAEAVEVDKVPVSVVEVCRDVVEMFSDRAKVKGISLKIEEGRLPRFKIDSDPARIRQILVNLVGNAVKFTSYGGVTIHGDYQLHGNDLVRVSLLVSDSGIGMSAETAKKLFQPFTQADSGNTRKFGGTGLGLAVSRKLGRALGGDVSIVACSENLGCTFQLEILAKISARTEADKNQMVLAPEFLDRRPLEDMRILVVDDSSDNRALIQLILQKQGAIVDEAENGNQAVEMALSNLYDMVLMDIQMPGTDGYEALSRLQSHNYIRPVVALTAHAMQEEHIRSLACGFQDHVTKPVNPDILIQSILTHARN